MKKTKRINQKEVDRWTQIILILGRKARILGCDFETVAEELGLEEDNLIEVLVALEWGKIGDEFFPKNPKN